ncbi:tyrosine-type recombinase/integrase [Acidovorax delafieldii]|nr:tyrosine-type recombinase/integrase [Acidovorax delafieldii]
MADASMNPDSTPAPEPTRILGTALVDIDEAQGSDTKGAHPPKRRRGRPPGTRVQVAHSHVTADEFAFLRALAQGVDLSVAARQYMLWPGRLPERAALAKNVSQLLARVRSGAEGLEDAKTASAMVEALWDLRELEEDPPEATAPAPTEAQPSEVPALPAPAAESAPPTLAEFASRFDEDMYSEAELVEMYREEYPPVQTVLPLANDAMPSKGDASPPAAAVAHQPFGEKVRLRLNAIDWLDEKLGVRPERDLPVKQWLRLTNAQVQALEKAGVITLGNLVDWMALRGEDWYSEVPGYGVQRANALMLWLAKWSIQPSQGLKAPQRKTVGAAPVPAPAGPPEIHFSLQALQANSLTPHFLGENGVFRSNGPNTFTATNDLEAVQGWFDLIKQKSLPTQIAYQRAIERLIRWAFEVRGLPLSSLSTPDLLAFKEFLAAPPPHWIQDENAPRNSRGETWRPLRGPLSDKSLELTFVAICSMYKSWAEKNYLSANPASDIKGSKRKDATMDVMRSFSIQQQEVIARALDEMKDGQTKRRLIAILWLLLLGGLRREEVVSATWGKMRTLRVDGRDTDQMSLEVLGKGNRTRIIPVHPDLYEALLAHRLDREQLMEQNALSWTKQNAVELMPLIGVLDERWIYALDAKRAAERNEARQAKAPTDDVAAGKLTVNSNGALSAAAIYRLLKSFFQKCSVIAGESLKDESSPFKRASTHWLRHTFAHNALRASGKDLELVKTILGHQSITTTALYVKAEMSQRAATINMMTPPK